MRPVRKPGRAVLDLLAGCSPGVAQLALALRELVLSEAPDAEEVLYSVYAQVVVFRIPGRKRGAVCGVVAYSRHVNLQFYAGISGRRWKGSGMPSRPVPSGPASRSRSYTRARCWRASAPSDLHPGRSAARMAPCAFAAR